MDGRPERRPRGSARSARRRYGDDVRLGAGPGIGHVHRGGHAGGRGLAMLLGAPAELRGPLRRARGAIGARALTLRSGHGSDLRLLGTLGGLPPHVRGLGSLVKWSIHVALLAPTRSQGAHCARSEARGAARGSEKCGSTHTFECTPPIGL